MATDVLRGALNTDAKSPVERFGGVLTGGSIKERGQAARQAMPTIMQESAQAAGQAKRTELEATNQQISREAAAEEKAATELRTETERIRGLEQPYQEFKAPEYTALDYAKGAAKRALVGVLLGGIAKTSALTQLKAVKAMQDAEKEGRTQDFEAARLSFDEAEKKRADFNKRLQTELSDFQQLLGKDTAAARLKAKMMTAQMMDGLASAAERNQNYKQFTEILTNATKQSNELEMEAFKQKGRLEEAEAKRKGEGAKIKITSEPEKRLTGARDSIEALLSIEERLKKPEVQKVINESEFFRTMLEKPTEMYPVEKFIRSQIYKNLPTEAKELFVIIAQARNDYYRQISGAAVTGSEGARNFFATVQPSDSAETLLTKSKTMKPKFIRQLEDFESDYEIGPGTQQRIRDLVSRAKRSDEDQSSAEDKRLSAPQAPAQPVAAQGSEPKPLTDEERRRLLDLRERARQRAGSGQ